MSFYDNEHDDWVKRDHERRTDKRIGSIVPAVTFKIRVRDDSIEGSNPYRWDDVTSYQIFDFLNHC
jgi:hypothetical protein